MTPKKRRSFTYSKTNKGKVWVSPNEAFTKTIKESKTSMKKAKGWMM